MPAPPELIDWGIAARIGRAVGGSGPPTTAELRRRFREDIARFSRESDELVRSFTGLQPADELPAPTVLDRGGWVRANLDGFKAIIRPLAEKLAGRVGGMAVGRRVASVGLGVQIGVLLGYLSQKVLGQYDLVLATEGAGRVYYVGPNIVEAERRWGLEPADFRLWIALHEITHRTQFAAVPWLRDTVRDMMDRSLGSLDLDPARLRNLIKRGRDLLAAGPRAWREASVMNVLLTDEQREIVAEMQALMTVVEGHGTFVMNRIGQDRIPSFARLRETLHSRRKAGGSPERIFQRAIGMEMKYQQYELGERFMDEVAARVGLDAVNVVWHRPENLPSPQELGDPDRWLARVW